MTIEKDPRAELVEAMFSAFTQDEKDENDYTKDFPAYVRAGMMSILSDPAVLKLLEDFIIQRPSAQAKVLEEIIKTKELMDAFDAGSDIDAFPEDDSVVGGFKGIIARLRASQKEKDG